MKKLIIVESPAKAKTIKNFLGNDYEVIASKGHIRDLPKSSFGIKIEEGKFTPQYRVSKEYSPIVKQIKELAKKSETIYIATDEDREGEAIGYHIAKAIGKEPEVLPRIVFHEITKSAITHAIENPRALDLSKVNAQQARRLLDRIVGYKLSPLLASKIQKGLSAGRVQSSSLKIIVDREREIEAFEPIEYWSITANFDKNIEAVLHKFEGTEIKKLDIKDVQSATAMYERIVQESFIVGNIDKRSRKRSAPPPFMTSTLQQSASTAYGFSPKKTMSVAQKLYEGANSDEGQMGLITYMRTDSLNIAKEAKQSAKEHILEHFGQEYLPAKEKVYSSKNKSAQEAHEAIRPTRVEFTPELAKGYLDKDELKVYTLIYNRFLASQMSDALFESQTILFTSDSATFKATGSRLVFDGFYKVLGDNDKDKLLPQLQLNAPVDISKLKQNQHFTEPPPRYSEASLIKNLEALGIGRPSTYAPTISILQSRDYIELEKKQIRPTKIAYKVIELLEKHFENIVDSSFTANMENDLDAISEDNKDWEAVLYSFYEPFIEQVEAGKKNIKSQKIAIPTGKDCPECGEPLVRRSGRFGEFIACSGFPKCKYTEQIDAKENAIDEKCDKCGAKMVVKNSKRGKFLACSAYPECKNTKSLSGAASNAPESKALNIKCPECGADIVERFSKRGKFYGCSAYPTCKFVSFIEPSDKKCPECNYLMGIKRYKRKDDLYECVKCKHQEPFA